MPRNTYIQARRGTFSEWAAENPVLASGEPGFDITNNILKIGDGVNAWLSLLPSASSDLYTYVKNTTGQTLYKGQVVYINSAQGDHPTVSLAVASGENTSSKTLGLLKENLLDNEFGYVVNEGVLEGLNTNGASAAGDPMWLSPTTPGSIIYGLSNKPYAPNHMVFLGYVLRKQLNNGKVYVKIQNGYELEELHNVAVTGAADGQFLQYNGSGLWIPSSSGNFTTLSINGTGVSISGHTHTVSDITDFNTSVSGLLPNGTEDYLPKFGIGGSGLVDSVIFDDGGSIGVGVAAPLAKLHILSSSSDVSVPIVVIESDGTQAPLTFRMSNTDQSYVKSDSGGNLAFGAQGAVIFEAGGFGYEYEVAKFATDGNVGIGVGSPAYKLDVAGTGNFSDNLLVNNIPVSVSGHTHLSSDITDFTSGVNNIVDTTLVAGQYVDTSYNSGTNTLTISVTGVQPSGSYSITGHTHASSDITDFNNSVSGLISGIYQPLLTNPVTGVGSSGYVSRWDGTNSLTSGIIFDNGTNVGIGRTAPSGKLHVAGDTYIDGYNLYLNSSAGYKQIYTVGNDLYFNAVHGIFGYSIGLRGSRGSACGMESNTTNGYLALAAGGSEKLRIDTSGNVGIGVTNPSSRLVVDGDVNIGSGNNVNRSLTIWGNNVSSKRTVLKNVNGDTVLSFAVGNQNLNLGETAARFYNINYYAGAAAGGNHNFYVSGTATPEVMIGSGVVGIGTTSPSGRLHVVGTGLFASTTGLTPNALLDVYSTTSGEMVFNVEGTNGSLFSVIDSLSGSLMSVNNNAGLPIFEVFSDDSIVAGRFNQNDFVISSGGNIGIGKASPSVKLDVVGTVAVSGAFSATTKSFKINHPSRPGYVLEYGSLESPYHGIRLTGKGIVVNGICIVNLPDYIKDLVLDNDSINIQITNYKHSKILYVQDIKIQDNTFEVGCDTNGLYDFFWTFTGLRKDIPQIATEYPL